MTDDQHGRKSPNKATGSSADAVGQVSNALRAEIEAYLAAAGPLVGGTKLWRTLGYQTSEAFRIARQRGDVRLRVFYIEGRRGAFAWKHELLSYLIGLGSCTSEPSHAFEEKSSPFGSNHMK